MVGVPRSTGCLACRKKKVKCDENAPICGRCQKSGRECSYGSRYKFVDETCKQSSVYRSTAGTDWHVSLPTKKTVWSFTSETRTQNGGLFQKWHRFHTNSAIIEQPALAPAEKQSAELVACLEEGDPGIRLSLIAPWLRLVPQRIGVSAALDDAVRVMTSTQAAMIRKQCPSTWISRPLYVQALQSLQKALRDPVEGYSIETLAATVLLYYLEATLGSPYEGSSVHHAGGASHLLETRGPSKHKNGFEVSIARQLQGPVAARALLLGVPCFMESPPWSEYLDKLEASSEATALLQEVMQMLVSWGRWTCEIRQVLSGRLTFEETFDMRNRFKKAKIRLDSLGVTIQEMLSSGVHATFVDSVRGDTMLKTVFDFPDYAFAHLLAYHAGLTLMINRMLRIVEGSVNEKSLSKIDVTCTELQDQQLVRRIFQSYEYAWKRRPIGGQYMHAILQATFRHAKTGVEHNWIIRALNELDEHRMLKSPRYTAFVVRYASMLCTGEAPVLKDPSTK